MVTYAKRKPHHCRLRQDRQFRRRYAGGHDARQLLDDSVDFILREFELLTGGYRIQNLLQFPSGLRGGRPGSLPGVIVGGLRIFVISLFRREHY